MLEQTLKKVVGQSGFATSEDVAALAKQDRLRQLLVRCGNCRFICAAQDVSHLIAIIERDGADHVRDVSLPAGDSAHRGSWHAHTFEGGYQPHRQPPVERATRSRCPRHSFNEADCGGVFDGFSVTSDADPGL